MKLNRYTLVELMVTIIFIMVSLGVGFTIFTAIKTGSSIVPNKQECLNAGGKWSEGVQYGRITQLCTYN
jgi:hypothetical protein